MNKDTLEQEPCDTCGYEEGSIYCKEPCEDWYDVPSNEMTLEQARQAVKDLRKKLAEHLEQESCDDAISRAEAVRVASGYCHPANAKELAKLPPVTPQPKTGHWIDIDSESFEFYRVYKCSECGNTEIEYPERICSHFKYCPDCGARMESEE